MGRGFGQKALWVLVVAGLGGLLWGGVKTYRVSRQEPFRLLPQDVSKILDPWVRKGQYPKTLPWMQTPSSIPSELYLEYSLDSEIQGWVDEYFQRYKPDYGSVVIMDSQTGGILAMSSFSRIDPGKNLHLEARFPAASLFKIVTAAAAIDQDHVEPSSVLSVQGANHTLYKRNVMNQKNNRWTRYVSLREAFAKSINSVFGKLGLNTVGKQKLEEYAEKFGFNQDLETDFPLERSHFFIPDEDSWAVVQAASGYTKMTTIGPVHGALLASAVANDGYFYDPHIVEKIVTAEGNVLYEPDEDSFPRQVLAKETAEKMKKLMSETLLSGTSRKSFKQFMKKYNLSAFEVGGKTGHLNGDAPKGRYDWFSGYLKTEKNSLAISVLMVNQNQWRIKSSQLAQMLFDQYLQRNLKSGIQDTSVLKNRTRAR